MDNTSNNTSSPKSPTLCTAGCGFFGSDAFNNMCSQCYKSVNKATTPATTATTTTTKVTTSSSTSTTTTATNVVKSPQTSLDDTVIIPAIERSRKHLRSPSPDDPRTLACNSAPTSAIASPAPIVATNEASSTASSPLPPTSDDNSKPVQTNKGRCFKCRLKVPLAKQAANKCRCGYVFCDSHRYPDRHDCDIDFAKLDREILAKNNPKLHERPRGGRSFQRIDSL